MAFKLGNKPLPGIAHGGSIDKKHKFIAATAPITDVSTVAFTAGT